MAEKTKIQWTEATWNPWHGCTKISAGCKYCYMFRDKERYNQDPTKVIRSKSNFNQPLKWEDSKLIFTCSWSDWFIEDADEWRKEAWDIIKKTPQHTYQILTKRPERVEMNLPWEAPFEDLPDCKIPTIYKNVWLGYSVATQKDFDCGWPIMEQMKRFYGGAFFVSAEPLVEKVDISDWLDDNEIACPDWVIVGGESGNETGKYRYRDCKIEWIEAIIAQCGENNVPVFVKQLGTHLSKKLGLRDRHGGDIDEWPEQLRIRQFPK